MSISSGFAEALLKAEIEKGPYDADSIKRQTAILNVLAQFEIAKALRSIEMTLRGKETQ